MLGDDKGALDMFARRKAHAEKEKKRLAEEERKGMAPVGSLMFSEVERRIDTFLFRCCFAHSVYEARRLVVHGYVMLNGKKVCVSLSLVRLDVILIGLNHSTQMQIQDLHLVIWSP